MRMTTRGNTRAGARRLGLIASGTIALALAGVSSVNASTLNDGRPEHRVAAWAGERAVESASMKREISTSDQVVRTRAEPGDAPLALSAATVPTSGEAAFHGPFESSRREGPLARGGGPRVSTQSISADEIGTARGLRAVGARTISAPLGCSRIEAVGAPRVRSVEVSVSDDQGATVAHVARRGRFAMLPFCAQDRGAFTVSARSVGGTVADPVQLFVQ